MTCDFIIQSEIPSVEPIDGYVIAIFLQPAAIPRGKFYRPEIYIIMRRRNSLGRQV